MNTMKKLTTMILALLLALCLGVSAFAEEAETPAADVPAAETPAAADTAVTDTQADANALNDALTAYRAAKAESRKQARLDKIKQELDGYVAAGSMTQEQADLILKYYAEQMTMQQGAFGFGRGGKGGRGGNAFGLQDSQGNGRNGNMPGFGNNQNQNGSMPGFGGGMGGRHGRFSSQPSGTSTQTVPAAPDANAPAGSAGI